MNDIKRDNISEYIIKETPYRRRQTINNTEYTYETMRKYKYRLAKEKKQLRNVAIDYLKTLDYTQLMQFLSSNNLPLPDDV